MLDDNRENLNEIAVIGYSLRVPNVNSPEEFWQVLSNEQCVVSSITPDRWSTDRYAHPGKNVPGTTYSTAAGLLENIWSFDPGFFGISPREAEQMDPQQRLLLEVTWEAMESSGLTPDRLDKNRTGVYVGASSSDYSTQFLGNLGAIDSQFMLGNTLSILSNRLSYFLDIKGPSYTVDTACSSSFYALDQAVKAMKTGEIDTAIVCGVNVLLSPLPFIGFSRSAMLSPDGLCKAFDASANGYVRSEGAVVFVIRKLNVAQQSGDLVRSVIMASGINSDGRTIGMAMPSSDRQADLLRSILNTHRFDPNDLAFVEAHGTGTSVGDPQEAQAIGTVFGSARGNPLPIGSAKSNFGHLESASGLVGLLKAQLSLENGVFPKTLHVKKLNPDIPFKELNLSVATSAVKLEDRKRPWVAGVNSFGFGGANSHVLLRQPWEHEKYIQTPVSPKVNALVLSAATEDALKATAANWQKVLTKSSDRTGSYQINNANHRLHRHDHRLVALGNNSSSIAAALEDFATGKQTSDVVQRHTRGTKKKVAFAFSGNGSQWPGMGRHLFETNETFRHQFRRVAKILSEESDLDIEASLLSDDLDAQLAISKIAQPLLFAIQVALVEALSATGLTPHAVIGHSVGEIAAAWVSGALSLHDATQLVRTRSEALEDLKGKGSMAAVLTGKQTLSDLLVEFGNHSIEVSAQNSPRSCTLTGPMDDLEIFAKFARKKRVAIKPLAIDYPFHSRALDTIKSRFFENVKEIVPKSGVPSYYSSTFGKRIDSSKLNSNYWWKNARNEVQFQSALEGMVEDGIDLVVEIGPRPVLRNYVTDTVKTAGGTLVYMPSMEQGNQSEKTVLQIVAEAIALGAELQESNVFGLEIPFRGGLPPYPWQHKPYRAGLTPQSVELFGREKGHTLLGIRLRDGEGAWHSEVDPTKLPWLADHVVDGLPVLPATAFVEIAMAAGKSEFGQDAIELTDFEILRPVVFGDENPVELRTVLEFSSATIRIESRKTGEQMDWQLCASGTLRKDYGFSASDYPEFSERPGIVSLDSLYTKLKDIKLEYGPAFRRLSNLRTSGQTAFAEFLPSFLESSGYALDPTLADAGFHGIFNLIKNNIPDDLVKTQSFLPVRFGRVRLLKPGITPAKAILKLSRLSAHGAEAEIAFYDAHNDLICQISSVRFKAIRLSSETGKNLPLWHQREVRLLAQGSGTTLPDAWADPSKRVLEIGIAANSLPDPDDGALLIDALAHRICWNLIAPYADAERRIHSFIFDKFGRGSSTLLNRMLDALVESDATTVTEKDVVVLAEKCPFPATEDLFELVTTATPERSGELKDFLQLDQQLANILQEGLSKQPRPLKAVDFSPASRSIWSKAADIIIDLATTWPKETRLNVLVLGLAPQGFIDTLSSLVAIDILNLSDVESRGIELMRQTRRETGKAKILGMDAALNSLSYDVVLHADLLGRVDAMFFSNIKPMLADGGLLVGVEREPDLVEDMIMGQAEEWWGTPKNHQRPRSRKRPGQEHLKELERVGLSEPISLPLNIDTTSAFVTISKNSDALEHVEFEPRSFRVLGFVGNDDLAKKLSDALIANGHSVSEEGEEVIYLSHKQQADEDDLTNSLTHVMALHQLMQEPPAQIWIISQNKTNKTGSGAAAQGLGRVLTNEYLQTEFRFLKMAPGLSVSQIVKNFLNSLSIDPNEIEILWDDNGPSAPRIEPKSGIETLASDLSFQGLHARTLEIGQFGNFESLEWKSTARRAPTAKEVEIAVSATGLNFRDVMWAQGLLPEEALEDGFAGATLGMECSGIVIRTGPDSTLNVGDHVIAFAPSCFSSHVTVSEKAVVKVPDVVDLKTAAAIPAIFVTAQYALAETARLKEGETVLIHGGAGGVGLAAIQIAKHLGANVIATAGSPEKRRLLQILGAKAVFDSRSLQFADDVMAYTSGKGVDVVLNSLSGEAMERSLGCLKAFGRFVELGKQDFYQNSRIGLRPFRQNLSYFGVDADQLLSQRPELVEQLFANLIDGFVNGFYRSPPCQIFEPGEVIDAFRLMQKSGHIGKILVRAPSVPKLPVASAVTKISGGAWLLVGGLGGFGLATARWLAKQGVEKLWLLGRSGTLSRQDRTELESTGVKIEAVAADAADKDQLATVFEKIKADHLPLKGVLHAAMVLDDALFSNQTPERMQAVMRAKIATAENLDTLTRSLPIDHFIVYSSVATLFGNPGQAAYVAANAYLEGLVASRCKQGLAGLAVAWGPLSDHGYLAREQEAREILEQRIGNRMLTTDEALEGLATIIASGSPDPVVTMAPMNWGRLASDLKLMKTALFSRIDLKTDQTLTDTANDLKSLINGLNESEALEKITSLLVEETAGILRQPVSETDPLQPLTDMGFDSLMAVNLRMAVEEKFGVDLPLMALVDGMTLIQLSRKLLDGLLEEDTGQNSAIYETIVQHLDENQEVDHELVEILNSNARTVTSISRKTS